MKTVSRETRVMGFKESVNVRNWRKFANWPKSSQVDKVAKLVITEEDGLKSVEMIGTAYKKIILNNYTFKAIFLLYPSCIIFPTRKSKIKYLLFTIDYRFILQITYWRMHMTIILIVVSLFLRVPLFTHATQTRVSLFWVLYSAARPRPAPHT